jgi:tetratricopeptide (TPR) repeat protein
MAIHMHEAGRWDTLAGWIDALPEPIHAAYPELLIYRGKIHAERGEHAQALSAYDKAERRFRDKGDAAMAARALAMKGYTLRFQGHYAEAITLSHEALALVSGTTPDERFVMAMAHKNVGMCYFRLGQLAEGGNALRQALDLYEALDDLYDRASVHHDLGLGCELAGDLEGAVEQYQAALQSWQQLGNPAAWANTLNGLGVVYQLQGRYEEGSQILEEALAKARQAGDLRVEAFVWASLGDLYRDLGAYERARRSPAAAEWPSFPPTPATAWGTCCACRATWFRPAPSCRRRWSWP